jgi:hypothetical protein
MSKTSNNITLHGPNYPFRSYANNLVGIIEQCKISLGGFLHTILPTVCLVSVTQPLESPWKDGLVTGDGNKLRYVAMHRVRNGKVWLGRDYGMLSFVPVYTGCSWPNG